MVPVKSSTRELSVVFVLLATSVMSVFGRVTSSSLASAVMRTPVAVDPSMVNASGHSQMRATKSNEARSVTREDARVECDRIRAGVEVGKGNCLAQRGHPVSNHGIGSCCNNEIVVQVGDRHQNCLWRRTATRVFGLHTDFVDIVTSSTTGVRRILQSPAPQRTAIGCR